MVFEQDSMFYLFDPHDLNGKGCYIEEGEGCACVLRFRDRKAMAERIYNNLFRGEEDMFCVSALGIKGFEKIDKCIC